MKRAILKTFFLFSVSVNAWAGYFTGNDLYQWLQDIEKSGDSSWQAGVYSGYISGVVDLGYGRLFCLGSGVTARQYNAIVTKFVKNNPEKWNDSADSLVVDALKEAFPCK